MVVTKTRFMNYMRCPRYAALDMVRKNMAGTEMTYDEYINEEQDIKLQEVMATFVDLDLIEDEVNEQLEVMMPYYSEIELLAGKYTDELLGGKTKYSKSTYTQESFDFMDNGVRFLCYVDIFNEQEDHFNIIEVKATTSKKFVELGFTKEKQRHSIWELNEQGIYELVTGKISGEEGFLKQKQKLYDRYDKCGRYVYDLAIQRYFIERDLKATNREDEISKVKYYLAVLNHEYIFDGTYERGKPVYLPDDEGNQIIRLFDMTEITKDLQDKINLMKDNILIYIGNADATVVPVGKWCELKKTTKCQFIPFCYEALPATNSVLSYSDIHRKINERDQYDLINDGIYKMDDVPYDWLEKDKHIIQRDTLDEYSEYIDHDKIRKGLDSLVYPLYHLDFETFPCPLPRFSGEKCYRQSVFQYSLHIETKSGECDFDGDHFEYLAKSHGDERRALIESLLSNIDLTNPGTIIVYNAGFEKGRLKELADIYPDLKTPIYKMIDMIFDLMLLLKGSEKLFMDLGFDKTRSKMYNYYHPGLSGSFSIKKVLPLFTDLTYNDLAVGNGMEAVVAYANYPKMVPEVFAETYSNLLAYCKQDTWAMVKVLDGLRQKNVSTSVQKIAL